MFGKPISLRTSPLLLGLVVLVTLAPVALLLYARQQETLAAQMASDVNRSGSLRFRSLWLYGATQNGTDAPPRGEDWPAMLREMRAIRDDLGARHLAAVRATDEAWQAFTGSLHARGRVDWATANRMRVAANTLTGRIDREAQARGAHVSRLLTLGTLGLALSLPLSLGLLTRLRRAQARIAGQNASLDKWNRTLHERQNELARANELLAQASHRFQELFQGLPVACFCYDTDGRVHEWNRACETLFGYQAWQTLGQSISELNVWPGDAAEIEALVARVCQNGEAVENREGSVAPRGDGAGRDGAGGPRFVLCSTFPLRGPAGVIRHAPP